MLNGNNMPMSSIRYLSGSVAGQINSKNFYGTSSDYLKGEATTVQGSWLHRFGEGSTNPKGEPQLGRRGLYRAMGGLSDVGAHEMAMLWVLNLSDGRHRLLEIAERSDYPFDIVQRVARMLMEHGLLNEIGSEVSNG